MSTNPAPAPAEKEPTVDELKTRLAAMERTLQIMCEQRNANAELYLNTDVNLRLANERADKLAMALAAAQAVLDRPEVKAVVAHSAAKK